MHEKKNPNKPLIVYYIIALVVVMLLNALLFPQIERYSVKQVDYSEFLSMLDEGKIKSVQIEDTQIAFTPGRADSGWQSHVLHHQPRDGGRQAG